MRIGIITFHWATNYGAVLQCFALQKVLKQLGHEVFIINYKPRKYDNNLWTFFRMRKFLRLGKFLVDLNKESKIDKFRHQYLNETKRYYSVKELRKQCNNFDAIISGSDQVLNVSFLRGGEAGGSTAYYLDFGKESALRICYAVSFGTTTYPKDLLSIVSPLVKRMNALSCREKTGIDILKNMTCDDVSLVPDPTLLIDRNVYLKLLSVPLPKDKSIFVYMLHNRFEAIKDKLPTDVDVSISTNESIEDWLSNIHNASLVVTNSFHGTVFCIHFHVPFYVVLPTLENAGMNDRFYTMLGKLGLSNRMVKETDFNLLYKSNIDWCEVDKKLSLYKEEGITFLNKALINQEN